MRKSHSTHYTLQLMRFTTSELEHLWNELWEADRYSRSHDPAKPSSEMESIMERIKVATALVGTVYWMKVPVLFIYLGRYRYWAEYMGIEYDYPTDEEFEQYIAQPAKKMGYGELA